jgi:hypothetical protein
MKYKVISNHDPASIKNAIEEERLQFIFYILESMGVPLEGCFPESLNPSEITVDHRVKMKDVLDKYNISFVDYKDKTFDIYLEKDKVATWSKPWVELKKDFSEINPKKRIYVEIHLECWSIFEKSEEINNEQ